MQNGARRMLTAAHCASKGTLVIAYTLGSFFPHATAHVQISNQGVDLALIKIDGPENPDYFTANIWVGENLDSSNVRPEAVQSEHRTFIGDRICTSGALSSTICGLHVSSASTMQSGRSGRFVRAENQFGGTAAGQGDSGGPAYTNGVDAVNAVGINSAGLGKVKCQGRGGRTCYGTVFISPISNARERLGVKAVTTR